MNRSDELDQELRNRGIAWAKQLRREREPGWLTRLWRWLYWHPYRGPNA